MKPKITIEESPRGLAIITEIHDSKNLRVGVLISRDQIGMLIKGGWCVKRKVPSEAASRKRARSGCFLRSLSNIEIAAAIYKSESVGSCSKRKEKEEGKGDGVNEK